MPAGSLVCSSQMHQAEAIHHLTVTHDGNDTLGMALGMPLIRPLSAPMYLHSFVNRAGRSYRCE